MTNINIINGLYASNADNVAAQKGADTEASGTQASAGAANGATAADELMSQLMDDRNAANMRTPAAMLRQALKDAGLAPNAQNLDIANMLVENGLPIGRDSLRSFVAQVKAYPEAGTDTLIAMARADIPVNAESVATVNEFMNNGQVLTSDVNVLADMIETVLADPNAPQELTDSLRQAVFETVYDAVNAEARGAAEAAETQNAAGTAATAQNAGAASPGVLSASNTALAAAAGAAPAIEGEVLPYRTVETDTANTAPDATAGSEADAAGGSLSGTLTGMESGSGETLPGGSENLMNASGTAEQSVQAQTANIPADAVGEANSEIMSFTVREDISGHNDYSFRDFDDLAHALAAQADAEAEAAGDTARSDASAPRMPEAFRNLSASDVKNLLKNSLSTRPEKLSARSIRELYERTSSFFDKVKEAAGDDPSRAHLASKAEQAQRDTSMLNALNRMYPHIELPLKLQNENAEGGLYVYTNRNPRVSNDGRVTALLHLNMPNLGLVDIHLDLKDTNLGMNCYCDDDAGRLLAGDITSLKEDLGKMGYSVVTRFNPAGSAKESITATLGPSAGSPEEKEKPGRLSFDIRA